MPDRLTIFAWLMAFANLAHQTTYYLWLSDDDPMGAAVLVAAIALLLRPGSLPLFLLLAVSRLAFCAYHLPFLHNHILIEGFAFAGILAGLVPELARRGRLSGYSRQEREELFDSFAATVRVVVLLVYFIAVFQKLNADFFDLEIGCGPRFLLWAREQYRYVPAADWARVGSIVFTLAIEAGIPLLLLFRRTRAWGILAGIGFHTLLGLHPIHIYTFSSLMVAMLFCWTPPGLPDAIDHTALPIRRQFRLLAPLTAAIIAACLAWKGGDLGQNVFALGLGLWCAWTLFLLTLYLPAAVLGRADEPAVGTLLRPIRPIQWALLLLLPINSSSPYLGLKTRTAISMHSNLRTEGAGWNHLLVPESVKIFGFQDDLVEVIESDLPEMQGMNKYRKSLPFFEFRRWCRDEPRDFFVIYRRNGQVERFEKHGGKGSDPALMETPPWPLERFLIFNQTDIGERQTCRAG